MAEDDPSLERPSAEELEENLDRTRQALERVTQTKIAAAMPVRCAEKTVCTSIHTFKKKIILCTVSLYLKTEQLQVMKLLTPCQSYLYVPFLWF